MFYAAVFDEAPRAREESWFALRSTLSATQAPCKLIGNFGGVSNWVHKLKEKSDKDPEYAYFRITCWDAVEEGILDRAEVEQAQKDLPPKIFAELYEAEATEDEEQLINNKAISKLFGNVHLPEGQRYITADIARLGNDKTVVFVWSGFKVIAVREMDVSRVTESIELIKQLQVKFKVQNQFTLVDEDGVGGGVVDGLGCMGFVNNSKPIGGATQNFRNLKNQCYYRLAEMINNGQLYVNCDPKTERLLTEELEWVRLPKEIDSAKIALVSKDEIKKRIGRSPDYSDALMMRMFYALMPVKRSHYHIIDY